jgi:hypothetical protein
MAGLYRMALQYRSSKALNGLIVSTWGLMGIGLVQSENIANDRSEFSRPFFLPISFMLQSSMSLGVLSWYHFTSGRSRSVGLI